VHGATAAVNPSNKYFQGKRRIPAPLTLHRHAGSTPLDQLGAEILGLSRSCPFEWCKSDGIVVISGEVGRLIVRHPQRAA